MNSRIAHCIRAEIMRKGFLALTMLSDSHGKMSMKGSGTRDMMDMLRPAASLSSPLACIR